MTKFLAFLVLLATPLLAYSSVEMENFENDFLIFSSLVKTAPCDVVISFANASEFSKLYFATLHTKGYCVERDLDRARKLMHESAVGGNTEAMYAIWNETVTSEKLTSSALDEANSWLIEAGNLGNKRAAKVLAECYEKGICGLEKNLELSKKYAQIYKN